MSKKYTHISQEQRYTISKFLIENYSYSKISKILGIDKSTVSREVRRNRDKKGNYKPRIANKKSKERKSRFREERILNSKIKMLIHKYIKLKWSPEQIFGYCEKKETKMVSIKSIYNYVNNMGNLKKHLRHNKPYKRKYGSGTNRPDTIKDRVSIDKRPPIVEEKSRIGDWEVDLIESAGKKAYLLVLVDRKTSFTEIVKLNSKRAEKVQKAIINTLSLYPKINKTITSDNGKEFTNHKQISNKLHIDFYFTNPYCSWEKGLVEYTNKLIRQYVPKKEDFSQINQRKINQIIYDLNNRPRKKLGFNSPNYLFFNNIDNRCT